MVSKAVVISRLTYASAAWWVYTTADNKQSTPHQLCSMQYTNWFFYTTEAATIAELDEDSDDKLFRNIQFNENHVL